MHPGWAKIKQASAYAGVSPRTMRDWLKRGLKHSRLPTGTILIRFDDVDGYLEGFSVDNNQVDSIVDETLKEINL